jgi:chromosome segregation ATPase
MTGMSSESRNEFEKVWTAVNKLRDQDHEHDKHIVELQMESNACKIAREALNSDVVDMCTQLKTTDGRITEKLDMLLAEYHRQQGKGLIISWLPTIISAVVGLMAVYTFMKGGNP